MPPATDVQRAQVATAVRALADEAGAGLPPPWPALVRASAAADEARVLDRLDQAVGTADVDPPAPRWWWAASLLQRLLAAVFGVGAVWIGLAGLAGLLRIEDVVPLPERNGAPIATWLLVGGLAGGLLLASLTRLANAAGARRRQRAAARALRPGIEAVADELVVAPVERELAAHETLRRSLVVAAGRRGPRSRRAYRTRYLILERTRGCGCGLLGSAHGEPFRARGSPHGCSPRRDCGGRSRSRAARVARGAVQARRPDRGPGRRPRRRHGRGAGGARGPPTFRRHPALGRLRRLLLGGRCAGVGGQDRRAQRPRALRRPPRSGDRRPRVRLLGGRAVPALRRGARPDCERRDRARALGRRLGGCRRRGGRRPRRRGRRRFERRRRRRRLVVALAAGRRDRAARRPLGARLVVPAQTGDVAGRCGRRRRRALAPLPRRALQARQHPARRGRRRGEDQRAGGRFRRRAVRRRDRRSVRGGGGARQGRPRKGLPAATRDRRLDARRRDEHGGRC